MNRISKSELVDDIAERCGVSGNVAAQVVGLVFQRITDAVANGSQVAITGFGTFEPRHRAARIGRNIKTGEAVAIGASSSMGFRASNAVKVKA